MRLTAQQEAAVRAPGNALVNAGAGTGKTRTLVERCIRQILDPLDPLSLDQVLVVTFTEAAAAEIRGRIRSRLDEEYERAPGSVRLREQLALLDTAFISTLHSFCLRLVREHACELGLDPQVGVLDEQQSAVLAMETFDALLADHYAGRTEDAAAVERLILEQVRGWDRLIRDLVLRLHAFTQTRPDPEGWFEREAGRFDQTVPADWLRWLLEGVVDWRDGWLPDVRRAAVEIPKANAIARVLEELPKTPDRRTASGFLRRLVVTLREKITGARARWPKPMEAITKEADFLVSLLSENEPDPIAQDWGWVRDHMTALLSLARGFSRRFSAIKQELSVVDFHDLEQFSLRLLWDPVAGRPTALAEGWRRRLRCVLVDEYQDINAAQDRILLALSREGPGANRFLVGDVKQSIYRFRQAAPRIFQQYATEWKDGDGCVQLTENFRSREVLLEFTNSLFSVLMHPDLGGVAYDEEARLQFGGRETRAMLSSRPEDTERPRVELLLHVRADGAAAAGEPSDGEEVAGLVNAEAEAHRIGTHLIGLREAGSQVWDDALQRERRAEWCDMVILLRSPRPKVEAFAKVFSSLGIPLEAHRAGFFDSIEVQDILQLLAVLDNPLQDLPLLAVLHSPLVGLSLEELARVRLAARPADFWSALNQFDVGHHDDPAWPRVHEFLGRLQRWRSLARQVSLSQRIELILQETSYLDWQATQPRGEQREANVRRLVELARRFDDRQRQGLHRFLRLIEVQREAVGEREPAPETTGQAVRLMSIHQSKGLEFPVVVVGDLGKPFNLSESKDGILLDEEYGLCPQVRPPDGGRSYPGATHWLARRRQRREALGEEMRLLYVALTRAQERVILVGSCTEGNLAGRWSNPGPDRSEAGGRARATNYLDWIAPWLSGQPGASNWTQRPVGQTSLCTWTILRDPPTRPAAKCMRPVGEAWPASPGKLADLKERLGWSYPFVKATTIAAKTSVTALRRGAAEAEDSEARPADFLFQDLATRAGISHGNSTAADRGTVYHRVLERLDLERPITSEVVARELQRLRGERVLSAAQAGEVDADVLSRFWNSELGHAIRARRHEIRRELPFTSRLASADLTGNPLVLPDGEFVVLQGVVDLALIGAQEIWVVDFKTDQRIPGELEERGAAYARQIQLYGHALSRIYRRPATQLWLCFLAAGRNLAVEPVPGPARD